MGLKLNMATLFSGIGAPEQGACRVYDDVNIVFACEWDKFSRESYRANYEIDPKHFHEDVRDLDATQYKGKVDVLVGGSPCQDFSIAGKGAGFDGLRGSLTGEFVRVLSEVLPSQFIFENVPGIKGPKFQKGLNAFVSELRDLGYHLHIEMANTKEYGVPQNRERYWIVGFLNIDTYQRFEFAPTIRLEKRLKDVLEDDVDSKYYLSQKALDGFAAKNKRYKEQLKGEGFTFKLSDINKPSSCLNARYYKCGASDIYIGSLHSSQCLLNINPSGNGMNGEVFSVNALFPTITTNKGEGIKVAGILNLKGADQIKRVYETGGGKPNPYNHARRIPRTEDHSKGFP